MIDTTDDIKAARHAARWAAGRVTGPAEVAADQRHALLLAPAGLVLLLLARSVPSRVPCDERQHAEVFLTEIGFAIAVGVLIDTFIVRSLLVPALTLELGDRVWWPSAPARRGSRGGEGRDVVVPQPAYETD